MAESGLTLALADFQHSVSEYLYGGDGTYANNTASEQDRINRVINQGLRQFYNPVSIGEARVHEWSFLNPPYSMSLNAAYSTGTVTVAAGVVTLAGGTFPTWASTSAGPMQVTLGGVDYQVSVYTNSTHVTLVDTTQTWAAGTAYTLHQDDYTLPANFSAFIGPLTFRQQDNAWFRVKLMGEGRIRELRQIRSYAGFALNQPWSCAVQPVVMDATLGTRNVLMFWPRITSGATVTFTYRVRPDILSVTNIYPYGASDHSDCIMASIMACAEQIQEQQRGVYWDNFLRLLQASIALDSSDNRPDELGTNSDTSDNSEYEFGRHYYPNQITYRGMQVP